MATSARLGRGVLAKSELAVKTIVKAGGIASGGVCGGQGGGDEPLPSNPLTSTGLVCFLLVFLVLHGICSASCHRF
jgi:hypothetical protein